MENSCRSELQPNDLMTPIVLSPSELFFIRTEVKCSVGASKNVLIVCIFQRENVTKES